MPKIVCVHSFRDGVGKTTVTANLAALLVGRGLRVCVVDTNFNRPELHRQFGKTDSDFSHALSDFLAGDCPADKIVYEITPALGKSKGRVYLIPAHSNSKREKQITREGFDPTLFREGLDEIATVHHIDIFLIDGAAGIDHAALPIFAVTDLLAIVMRLGNEDFQGTGVLVEIADKMEVPHSFLVVCDVPDSYDFNNVRGEVERVYGREVGAVVPHVEIPPGLGKTGITAIDFPNSPMVLALSEVAKRIVHWKG
ncbi:MAG: AAA family ATPase [Anaerolineae bacterium]|nr:AAA family ATPase [Anaerolineae bacterium]